MPVIDPTIGPKMYPSVALPDIIATAGFNIPFDPRLEAIKIPMRSDPPTTIPLKVGFVFLNRTDATPNPKKKVPRASAKPTARRELLSAAEIVMLKDLIKNEATIRARKAPTNCTMTKATTSFQGNLLIMRLPILTDGLI